MMPAFHKDSPLNKIEEGSIFVWEPEKQKRVEEHYRRRFGEINSGGELDKTGAEIKGCREKPGYHGDGRCGCQGSQHRESCGLSFENDLQSCDWSSSYSEKVQPLVRFWILAIYVNEC